MRMPHVIAIRPVCIHKRAFTGFKCFNENRNRVRPTPASTDLASKSERISLGTSNTSNFLYRKKRKSTLNWIVAAKKTTVKGDTFAGPLIMYDYPKRIGIWIRMYRIHEFL